MTVLLAPWYPTSAAGMGGASPAETGSYQRQLPRLRKADGLGLLSCPGHSLHPLGCYAEGGRHNQIEGKQKAGLLKLHVFKDIQKWVGALNTA